MPEPVMSKKNWTLMVYMGGFNDLDPFVLEDMIELETIGSNAEINVIVQVDLASESGAACRHYIQRNSANPGTFSSPIVGHTSSDPNVGDPRELVDFIQFSANNYPADHYMLVLWGHGLGVFDEKASDTGRVTVSRTAFANVPYQLGNVLAKPTRIGDIQAKLVIIDPETGDSLTDQEIGNLCEEVIGALGKKIDILQLDACYMATTELAKQCAGLADFMVGSEFIVPYKGMPYGANGVLGVLGFSTDARKVARGLVSTFMEAYREEMFMNKTRATISALDLVQVPQLGAATDSLAEALTAYLLDQPLKGLMTLMEARAETEPNLGVDPNGWDPGDDIVDLFALAKAIGRSNAPQEVLTTAATVVALTEDVVFAEGHGGKDFSDSSKLTGLTTYLPRFRGDISNLYLNRSITYPYQYEINNPKWFDLIDRFQFPVQMIDINLAKATAEAGAAAAALRKGKLELAVFDPTVAHVRVCIKDIELSLKWPQRTEIYWQVDDGSDLHEEGMTVVTALNSVTEISFELPTTTAVATLCFTVRDGDSKHELLQVPVQLFHRLSPCLLVSPLPNDIMLGDEAAGAVDALVLSEWPALTLIIISTYADGIVVRSQPSVNAEHMMTPEEILAYLHLLQAGGHVMMAGRDIRYSIETADTPETKALLAATPPLTWSEPDFTTQDFIELAPIPGSSLAALAPIRLAKDELKYCDVFETTDGTGLLEFVGFGACATLQNLNSGQLCWVGFNFSSMPTQWIVDFCTITLDNCAV